MTLTPEPPARQSPHQRSFRRLGITTIVFAFVATVLSLLPSAASAATHNFEGRLVKGATSTTHQVTVEKGILKATLSFTFSPTPRSGTPTAKVTLKRADGTVVASSYGSSPLTLQRDVAAGTYRLKVSTSWALSRHSVDYRLVVNSPDVAAVPEPTPEPEPTPDPEPAPEPTPESTPTSDPNPSPQNTTYATNGSTTLTTSLGEAVHVRYPTSNGAMAADRPVVLIGHGLGMGSDMDAVMNGGTFLNRAGYVTASTNMDAQSSYADKARLMSRVLDAVVESPALAAGVLPNRVGYYGGSNGAITAVTMQDPAVRDERFDAFVMRSPWHREGDPSWEDAPPTLVMLGTADPTVRPERSREVYAAATHPKGKIELGGANHSMTLSGSNIVQDASKAMFNRFLNGVATGLDAIPPLIAADDRLDYEHDWALDTVSTPDPDPDPTPDPVPDPTPDPAPDPGPAPAGSLADMACGTWVLYQVSSVTELERLRPRIEAALRLPGVAGFSVRFPWDAADMSGTQTTTPILEKAKEIAASQGKPLSVRFMAGAHTPARVFDAGAAYYTNPSGRKVPLPWDNATGTNDVFLDAYDAYVGKLAAWSRANGVSLLHLSWYGQDWAELNHGKEVRAAAGYTQDAWTQGHRELIRVGARHASTDLAVEMPLSGYGPLSGGQSAALADEIMAQVGQGSDRFFVQANGWDETREWGAPDMTVESQFDKIWAKPVLRGLQMIQPDGYDWARVFDRLDLVGATYGEVYLPSFWQVPGPAPQYNRNTTERIAQLEAEIRAFAERTC